MKHAMILALTIGAAGFLCAQSPSFNSMRTEYYKNQRTKPADALKIAQEMEKLPNLTQDQKYAIMDLKLGAAYNMGTPEVCIDVAKEIIASDAPAKIKAGAYFLGGIRQGVAGNDEEFLRYMLDGIKIAPDAASKYNLMIYHIAALQKLNRKEEAIEQGKKCVAFAKEQKNLDWELRAYYMVVSSYPQNERCALLEEALKAENVFDHPYAQHISRTLINSYYRNSPEKAKALCERVLKESKRVIYSDFKKKLEELSK